MASIPRLYFLTEKKYVWFMRLGSALALTLTLDEGLIHY